MDRAMVLGKAEVKDCRDHSLHVPQDGPGKLELWVTDLRAQKTHSTLTCYGAQEQGLHYVEGIMSVVCFLKAPWWASHGGLLKHATRPSQTPSFPVPLPQAICTCHVGQPALPLPAPHPLASTEPGPNHKTLALTTRQLCFQCKHHHLDGKYSLPRSKAI